MKPPLARMSRQNGRGRKRLLPFLLLALAIAPSLSARAHMTKRNR